MGIIEEQTRSVDRGGVVGWGLWGGGWGWGGVGGGGWVGCGVGGGEGMNHNWTPINIAIKTAPAQNWTNYMGLLPDT